MGGFFFFFFFFFFWWCKLRSNVLLGQELKKDLVALERGARLEEAGPRGCSRTGTVPDIWVHMMVLSGCVGVIFNLEEVIAAILF
jgi:hypothetical protein